MLILVKMSGMAESVIDRVVKSDSLLSLVVLRALVMGLTRGLSTNSDSKLSLFIFISIIMGLTRGQRAALVISCCLSEKLEPDQGPGWPAAKTDDTQINWHKARKQFEEELFFFSSKTLSNLVHTNQCVFPNCVSLSKF